MYTVPLDLRLIKGYMNHVNSVSFLMHNREYIIFYTIYKVYIFNRKFNRFGLLLHNHTNQLNQSIDDYESIMHVQI